MTPLVATCEKRTATLSQSGSVSPGKAPPLALHKCLYIPSFLLRRHRHARYTMLIWLLDKRSEELNGTDARISSLTFSSECYSPVYFATKPNFLQIRLSKYIQFKLISLCDF